MKLKLSLCLGLCWMLPAVVRAEVSVGDPFPTFALEGSDGETYTSDQYRGKQPVVIAWFPKAFTGGCTKECKSLRDNSKTLQGLGAAYFTASCDPPEKNAEFAKSLNLDYPILSDPTKRLAGKLGCLNPRGVSNRWTYYIDTDGVVVHIDKSVKAGAARRNDRREADRAWLGKGKGDV